MLLERLSGVDDAMIDAVEMKMMGKVLTKDQLDELFKDYYRKP